MTNPLFTVDQLPTTSAQALIEFNDRYIAALGASAPSGWADKMGALFPTNAPMITFPITQLRTKYRKTQGSDSVGKRSGEKSFSLRTEEFDDGYEAPLKDLFKQVFAYRRWQEAPARLVLAEEQFRHDQIATLLEDGVNQDCYDGKKFFATDHPANLFDDDAGSFSNYQSVAKDVVSIPNLQAEVVAMQTAVLDENGKRLGVMPDTVLVPLEKAEPLKNLLKQNMIADANNVSVTNPYMNGFNVVPCKELSDTNDWFLVDSKLVGELAPWLMMRENMPASLALRQFDESSDFFKKSGMLRVESHIWYGFSLGFPHAIRLIKGA